jgi:hypothetical protein
MKPTLSFAVCALGVVLFFSANTWAWGRRGHQIVNENAAQVAAAQSADADFMSAHSFDFGYYANVPDFAWKRPATYATEKPQHFMDMEIFDREFAKHPEVSNPLALERKEFEQRFRDIKPEAGRSFWRIRELYARLEKLTLQLREMQEMGEARQNLQGQWLLTAGTMGHYIGDLGMPLHVSENYDGLQTGQKGIHQYFEEIMVDQLYPEIGCEVHADAMKRFPEFTKKNADKSVLQLLVQLSKVSRAAVPRMLAIDKHSQRENLKKNAKAFHPLIREQLVQSTLVLAELYRRQLGWKFDSNKFYLFYGEPEYIQPGTN